MKQTFTSAATSVNAARLPAVYRKISPAPRSLLFDYGAGRFTDHIRAHLGNVVYLPYDPYNLPEAVNCYAASVVANAMHFHAPVTVVCSNVLNVIDSDDECRKIAGHIADIVCQTGGAGYVTVYEGNRSGVGRQTGPDQYQRNAPLRAYLSLFPLRRLDMADGTVIVTRAEIKRGMIVVTAERRQ